MHERTDKWNSSPQILVPVCQTRHQYGHGFSDESHMSHNPKAESDKFVGLAFRGMIAKRDVRCPCPGVRPRSRSSLIH